MFSPEKLRKCSSGILECWRRYAKLTSARYRLKVDITVSVAGLIQRISAHSISIGFKIVKVIKAAILLFLLVCVIKGKIAIKYEPPHDKTNNVAVYPAKTKISLGIHPV